MIRKSVQLVALTLGTALLAGTPADVRADDASALSIDLSTGFMSDYMWRGFNLYDDASIQPSATVEYDTGFGTIGGNLWMHLSAGGTGTADKFTEMDETVYYSIEFAPVTLKTGFVWYTYPDNSDDLTDTVEWLVTASFADDGILGEINPVVSFYDDFKAYDAQYYELGFSHEFEVAALGEGFKFVPYGTFGFASNAEEEFGDNGLVQVTEGINIPLTWGVFSVTPGLNYTNKVADNTDNEFWTGINVGYSF